MRMEVAPVGSQIITLPFRLGTCPACKQHLMGQAYLRVADGVEFALFNTEEPVAAVDMQPVGVRIAHDCVPGPAPTEKP